MSSIVRYHLYANGIDKSYKIWFWHGEDLKSETVTSKMENIVDEKYEQDDLFNIVNIFQSAHDGSCNTSNIFDTMFDDAKKPLYPGCKKFTKLSALVRLYNLKVRYGWSNTSFSELLSIISDLLPDNNKIPTSLYEVNKTLGALGLSYQKIDACPNDCCLYRKEYANSTKCPKYGLSRWKINKNSTKENNGVAAKQLWYFPIVLRFIRMFKNLKNAKNLRWHAMDRKVDGIMRHPVDTPSWRLIDHMWRTFGSEPKNLRLGLKQPRYDINTYLAPLIDNLKILWEEGVRCFDAYKEKYFTLRVVLLWTINDFLAYEHGNPPQPLSGEVIYFKLKEMIFSCEKKCGKNNNKGGNDYWKRRSEFFELPYWKNLHVRHCLDVMHIEKNVCMNIVGTLLDLPGKSKDGMNSRRDIVEMNIRPELAPMVTELDALQEDIVMTFCNLEKYFPPSFFIIMVHLVVHLVREVKLCGPVYLRWMYPFERYMKVLKSFVRNRNRPEGCIVEAQVCEEAVHFCSDFLYGLDEIGLESLNSREEK
ncbi:transposase [Cucumis melo var. makuwa]|uniref:Transposase n=1 Tax=Cucumis melo var. makuwa TaxID=1194695 RepID=A0A5A7SUG2_CUCMM|nr:transposase [Cucumis melo var. makuwa]